MRQDLCLSVLLHLVLSPAVLPANRDGACLKLARVQNARVPGEKEALRRIRLLREWTRHELVVDMQKCGFARSEGFSGCFGQERARVTVGLIVRDGCCIKDSLEARRVMRFSSSGSDGEKCLHVRKEDNVWQQGLRFRADERFGAMLCFAGIDHLQFAWRNLRLRGGGNHEGVEDSVVERVSSLVSHQASRTSTQQRLGDMHCVWQDLGLCVGHKDRESIRADARCIGQERFDDERRRGIQRIPNEEGSGQEVLQSLLLRGGGKDLRGRRKNQDDFLDEFDSEEEFMNMTNQTLWVEDEDFDYTSSEGNWTGMIEEGVGEVHVSAAGQIDHEAWARHREQEEEYLRQTKPIPYVRPPDALLGGGSGKVGDEDPFHIVIDKVQKKIHVLDERGTEVNPHTGRPRRVPKLRVLEVPVPSYVQPGHWFTYVLAGVGHVRCKAPKVIADLGPGLAGPRRPQMLVAVPELEMRAIHDRFTDGAYNPFFYGALATPETFPPEICYTDPRIQFVPSQEWNNCTWTDGEWHVPEVNQSEYNRAQEAALKSDADAAWDFFLEHDGTISKERIHGRVARRRANHFGMRRADRAFRIYDSNMRYVKPDVHYSTGAGSLYRNYTQLVDGDCPKCSVYPPSRLAFKWLPRAMWKQYMMLVNVSEAAEQGDPVAIATLPYFNISALVERMSRDQELRYNNGRLRIRYAYKDTHAKCKECGGAFKRTPFELNDKYNETLVETTYDWLVRRQLFVCAATGDAISLQDLKDTIGCDPWGARDPENDDCTALHAAVIEDHVDVVNLLVSWNVSLNATDRKNWTALDWASQRNSIRCVQALIGAGADVNRAGGLMTHHGRYAKGFTPLHYAAFNGHVTVVRLLVEAGANIEARDFWGLTPLHVAAVWAQPTACEVLIELGADELAEDHEGFSPVESADHAYMHYHFESWINETNWLKSPHMSFPGVKVWKECSERIKIAVEDRMSRERLRLEAIGSGRGMMGQIVGMKRMAADSQGRDYPEGKRFRDDGIVENV